MNQPFVHPSMLSRNTALFPSLCSIQTADSTLDDAGQPAPGWTTVHADVRCRVTWPATQLDEVRTQAQTYAVATVVIALAGYYDVTPLLRVVAEGKVFDVAQVRHDGNKIVTYLDATVVT